MRKYIIFLLILLVAVVLRFYKLDTIPAGLHGDAASQGYNAYSLKLTGQDRYGESFPVLFRSLGSYQPPLYTYLTIIPISIFGNTAFAARFISALSGVLLVLVTFWFMNIFFKKTYLLTLLSGFILAIIPWSVFFSRQTIEANLGLVIFAISLTLFVKSLDKPSIFPFASLLLGLSTHAYYSERLISILFLSTFVWLFKKTLFQSKALLVSGIIIFLITQIPHLYILQTGALTKRFDQVSYFNGQSDLVSLGKLFLNSYFNYFSPKNLFSESSVFYIWCIVPLLFGFKYLLKNKSTNFAKIILLLLVITPIPAALTGDVFYSLRILVFLWAITITISIGIYQIYVLIKHKSVSIVIASFLIWYSLFSFYISYFIIFRYEKAQYYGYSYIKLINKLSEYGDKKITIDSGRDPGIGVRIAYLLKYDPRKIQQQLKTQMTSPYYSSNVSTNEIYKIHNIEIKRIDWSDDCNMDALLIGDFVSISDAEVEKHKLKLEFEIPDITGKVALRGFSPLPKDKCLN